MNSKKKLLFKCTLATALVPFNTYATTGHTGLEACADALASKLSASNGTSINYELDPANEDFDRRLQSLELFSLYARDPNNSELVSRMDCVVNSAGRVVRLIDKPLVAEDTSKQVSKID
jgi:hypothetical protein